MIPRGLRSSAEQSGEGEAVHESEAGGDPDLAASGERPDGVYPETRIDNAIMLSTTRLGALTKPKAARARVMLCPTANPVTTRTIREQLRRRLPVGTHRPRRASRGAGSSSMIRKMLNARGVVAGFDRWTSFGVVRKGW